MTDGPQEGDKAPAFSLTTENGDVHLSDYKGALVLYFYPKDDTSGCTKQAIAFSEHLDAFEKAGAKVLGVSKDPVKKHIKFREKHGLTVPLASDDETFETLEAYGVWKEKSMYGRTYMGIERSTFLIDGGKVVRAWRKVKVPGHVEEVLEAVQAL